MRAQRERDTDPELALRRALHAQGLRYRVHRQVVPGTRRQVDVVFPTERVAVDVRGCFWHVCPEHATWPKRNGDWWEQKLNANVVRDLDTEDRLHSADWVHVVVWEHEDPNEAARRIHEVVVRRRP